MEVSYFQWMAVRTNDTFPRYGAILKGCGSGLYGFVVYMICGLYALCSEISEAIVME